VTNWGVDREGRFEDSSPSVVIPLRRRPSGDSDEPLRTSETPESAGRPGAAESATRLGATESAVRSGSASGRLQRRPRHLWRRSSVLRVGSWETWLWDHRPLGVARWLVLGLAVTFVLLVGLLDPMTSLSLAILSLLPVLVVTLVVSGTAGVAVAFIASSAGFLGGMLSGATVDWDALLGDRLLELACLVLAVAIVAGLRAAMAEAHASDMRAREFLAYLAHQLRTPVAGIRSNAEALILSGEPPGREHLLASLVEESDRIGRLMSSLLRIARLDNGDPFETGAVDVVSLSQREVERARQRTGDRIEIDFETGLAPREPVTLSEQATREALTNLIENAVRHASTRVVVVVSAREKHVEITVADDGAGLPPGCEEKAFQRFVTLDRCGAGLGLPIARALCESQGGRLVYDEGKFVMRLPQRRSRT